uniref:Uncharacterized protein n=1 Tax=Timema monikensis TaxID=170555 RepID=A0A7R9DYZ2_9NEOP|nr:unnamed protein product [Timema monikensis]
MYRMQGALHLILPLVSMVSLCKSLILGSVRPGNFTLLHEPENPQKVAFGQPDVNHYLQRQPGPQQYRNDSLFYADGPLFKWLPPGGRGKRYVTAEETKQSSPDKQETQQVEGLSGLFDNQGQNDLVRGKRKSLARREGYDGVPPITFELIQACRAARLDWPPCNLFFSYPWSVYGVDDKDEGNTELEDEDKWLPDPEVDTISLQDNSVSVDTNPRGKRSNPLERKRELNAFREWDDESISKFSNWFRKRGQKFFSWGGKKDPKLFNWGGKRDPRFFSWGGKRDPRFFSWGGKRDPKFFSWGGKRDPKFFSWGGKRDPRFFSWGGKRDPKFFSWGGKRDPKFFSWGGKRDPRFFSWGGKRDPKFFSWGGKRDPRFFSWGGKRDPKFISWNEKTNLDMVQPASKNNYINSFPFKKTVSIPEAEGIKQVFSSQRGEIIPLDLAYSEKNDKSDQMLPTDQMSALGETRVMHDHDNNDKHVVTTDQKKSEEDNFQPTFNDVGHIKPLSNREGIKYSLYTEDEDENISFFDSVDSEYKQEFPSISEK